MPAARQHIAFYPGSFDPPTYGHLDVIARGRRIFDRVVVGVGQNPDKESLFSAEERLDMLRALTQDIVRQAPQEAPVDVMAYDGLTVDTARRIGATVLLRGIRNLSDLQNEVQQAITNREVAGLETAFVVAGQSFAYTSSTLIKQITALGQDLDALKTMCPPPVIERLRAKKSQNAAALRSIVDAS